MIMEAAEFQESLVIRDPLVQFRLRVLDKVEEQLKEDLVHKSKFEFQFSVQADVSIGWLS